MKATTLILFVNIMALSTFSQDISGKWNGILEDKGDQLRIVFKIEKTSKGYSSTMESPDQNITGIPVTTASFENLSLRLTILEAAIEYNGTLNDKNEMIGHFVQDKNKFPLKLSKENFIKRF